MIDRIAEIEAWYIGARGARQTRLQAIERDIATLIAEVYKLRAQVASTP